MTGVNAFVSALHFVNSKNTVEYIVMGIALVKSTSYRGTLICLEIKCITN